jgi:hypothetical protein
MNAFKFFLWRAKPFQEPLHSVQIKGCDIVTQQAHTLIVGLGAQIIHGLVKSPYAGPLRSGFPCPSFALLFNFFHPFRCFFLSSFSCSLHIKDLSYLKQK